MLAPARELLAVWAAEHRGTLLEDKQDSLALHYRNAPLLEPAARRAVTAALEAVSSAFHLQEGKKVLEIKARDASKGRAIEEFMAEPPFIARQAIFLGDDLTDLPVLRRALLSVLLGHGPFDSTWGVTASRDHPLPFRSPISAVISASTARTGLLGHPSL